MTVLYCAGDSVIENGNALVGFQSLSQVWIDGDERENDVREGASWH